MLLVADDCLAAEYLLIGLPVLKHLGIDTKTLLEQKRNLLDGIYCSSVCDLPSASKDGSASRHVTTRINRVIGDDIDSPKQCTED